MTRHAITGALYMQVIHYNEYMFTDMWYDTDGNREIFETTIIGHDKKGNPIFKVDAIYSNILLVNNRIKYYTIAEWKKSLQDVN